MKNLGLKLFSLLIASLLVYYVHSDSSEGVIGITVPVELKGLSSDRVVIAPQTRQAQVSLKGPSFLLSQVYASPPTFRIKVPQDAPDKYTATLDRSDLSLPAGVKAINIEPHEMEFIFDTLSKKEVPVQIVQTGAGKNTAKIVEMVTVPTHIVISGPSSELKAIKAIETEALDLRDITADSERSLDIRKQGRWVEYSATQVHVKVVVAKEQKERRFEGLAVEIRSTQPQLQSLEPETVAIEVSGAVDKVEALKPEEVLPYIRISPGDTSNKLVAVSVDLPKGVSLVMIEPRKVKIIPAPIGKKK